jgi:hypothetical protein
MTWKLVESDVMSASVMPDETGMSIPPNPRPGVEDVIVVDPSGFTVAWPKVV